jgi:hypothetical protein
MASIIALIPNVDVLFHGFAKLSKCVKKTISPKLMVFNTKL